MLQYRKLSKNAKAPLRGTPESAGFDLSSAQDVIIPALERCLVATDLQIVVPSGCYGRIAPRSSLAIRKVDVAAGVVDADYRGNVRVLLVNNGFEEFHVKVGERIAQIICERIVYPQIKEITEELDDTIRGQGGFGSTGK